MKSSNPKGSLLLLDILYNILYIVSMNNLLSISDVRANLPELVTRVEATMSRVVITVNGQPKATLVSSEELESLEEMAELLVIPRIKETMLRGLKQAKKSKGKLLSDLK